MTSFYPRNATALLGLWLLIAGLLGGDCQAAQNRPELRIATFNADVTVPIGHGMMGGLWLSKSIADPLEARGIVLLEQIVQADRGDLVSNRLI